MTNHEAIEMIRNDMKLHYNYLSGQYRKALNMAISALEAQEQKERDCSTCKHKDLCDAFWTQEIEDAPCRECDELAYQKWEPQKLANNSKKLDSENNEHLATNLLRCKDCQYWQDNNGGYPHSDCKWNENETPDEEDFCSGAERLR